RPSVAFMSKSRGETPSRGRVVSIRGSAAAADRAVSSGGRVPPREKAMASTRRGEGQTALVTGASAGIGVDLAECFAQDGYDLILTARTESALREVADRLSKAHGITATPIAADLGAIGGGARLAEAIKQRGLPVDVVVNNAGYG